MESLNIPLDTQEMEYHVQTIFMQLLQVKSLPRELEAAISALWADNGFQEAYRQRFEYQMNDNTKSYVDDIRRLALPDYMPSTEDILCSRVRTTGILETTFNVKSHTLEIFDVGGVRSERKEWTHVLGCVNNHLYSGHNCLP